MKKTTKKVAKKTPSKTTSTKSAKQEDENLASLASMLASFREREEHRAVRQEEDLVIHIKLEIGQGGTKELLVDIDAETVLGGALDDLRLPDAVDLVRDTLANLALIPAASKIQQLTNAWMIDTDDTSDDDDDEYYHENPGEKMFEVAMQDEEGIDD